ncbi:MAG TPA: gephyrin-like molybdotransferase Glp [Acidimicrobiales bacterium]|nr:gephyrin-like molybdotransferase Glp [Acidimicrobiales bacterium]
MIALDEAQTFVLDNVAPLPIVVMPLDEALGCVLGRTVNAVTNVPSFPNSSMDGYALRAADTVGAPVTLRVVGSLSAGHVFPAILAPGEGVRIMTGAPVPQGADAICMVELCEANNDEGTVIVTSEVATGNFIRDPGYDVTVDQVIGEFGTTLRPTHLGVLAAQGMTMVPVHRRPRLGVLSTGDELFAGKGRLPLGKIRDANRHSLLGLIQDEGWVPVDLGSVPDNQDTLADTMRRGATSCDALITSGGVSVGDFDVVRLVLSDVCAGSARWMQIAIRPAKPFVFGVVAETKMAVFGLPGNPVSAMVSFELLVRPAVRRMAGNAGVFRAPVLATALVDITRVPDGKVHYVRGRLSLDDQGRYLAHPLEGQESHQLSAMANANALLILPDGEGVRHGSATRALLFSQLTSPH